MNIKKLRHLQSGSSMVEAIIAIPLVVVACLLTLQMMLLYRAKISLNFATQEAARIGAMSNGRVVPRFLTDITQFSSVIRKKKKCTDASGNVATPTSLGGCPKGSTAEVENPNLTAANLPGANTSADGNPPTGAQFSETSSITDGTAAPAQVPTASDAAAARKGNSAAAKDYLKALGRGMMRYGDSSVLQGFIMGIAPLYTSGIRFSDVARAQVKAYGDAMMNSCIFYHSPTQAAFLDFGFMEIDGPDSLALQIPNDLLRYRVPGSLDPAGRHIGYYKKNGKYLSDEEPGLRGLTSSMSVQDATLLSIEIKYSYALDVPIARDILVGLAKLTGSLKSNLTPISRAFNTASLDKYRWPMSAFATYRMQTPVHWHMFYPFGDMSNVRSSKIEAFDAIQLLYNAVADKVNDSFDPADPQIGFCPGLIYDAAKAATTHQAEKTEQSWVGKNYDTTMQ